MTIIINVPALGPTSRQKPILASMQSAAIRLVGRKPSVFFGAQASAVFDLEITDLINEVARDIAQYQDWQAITSIASLTGDGSSTIADLPNDYDRQTLISDLQSKANWMWGYSHVTDMNEVIFDENSGLKSFPGMWSIFGNKLRISPAPSGTTQFPYISANWAIGATGTLKYEFDADTDIFLLPERLLTLGLVWRWRENKKLDASGDQEAFIKALDEYGGKDKGSSVIRFTGRRRQANTVAPYTGTAY